MIVMVTQNERKPMTYRETMVDLTGDMMRGFNEYVEDTFIDEAGLFDEWAFFWCFADYIAKRNGGDGNVDSAVDYETAIATRLFCDAYSEARARLIEVIRTEGNV